MEVRAFKADDGSLYENEKDCHKRNIELKLKAWLKEDNQTKGFSIYCAYEDIVIPRIAEKIINDKQSFNEIFKKIMEI